MDKRAHIIVSGMVQGVGFRYFVTRLARRHGLTGWVKNLPTGEVEILVEGLESVIRMMIPELKTGNAWANVKNVSVAWETYQGSYKGFDIKY